MWNHQFAPTAFFLVATGLLLRLENPHWYLLEWMETVTSMVYGAWKALFSYLEGFRRNRGSYLGNDFRNRFALGTGYLFPWGSIKNERTLVFYREFLFSVEIFLPWPSCYAYAQFTVGRNKMGICIPVTRMCVPFVLGREQTGHAQPNNKAACAQFAAGWQDSPGWRPGVEYLCYRRIFCYRQGLD